MYFSIALVIIISLSIGFLKKITFTTEYILLLFILVLAVFHIYAYNTDAEDAYIAYRYSQNFAAGNGLVFNAGEHVEGYSDFIWVVLLGILHKITTISLPLLGRGLGVILTLVTIILTYFTAKKLTNDNKKLSLFSILILSCSGSFIAYAIAGLEVPLFALFVIIIFNLMQDKKWTSAGIMIGLTTMIRPEGIMMFVPLFFAIVIKTELNYKQKIGLLFRSLIGVLLLILPWTAWRLYYYGYFIPNAMAAKRGMDTLFQLHQGVIYFFDHWIKLNAPLFLGIIILFAINGKKWKSGIVLFSVIFVYSLFYILIGGDWMPVYRFYSPFYPIMVLLIVIFLNNYHSILTSLIRTAILVAVFQLSAFYMLDMSFNEMIPKVHIWSEQVRGLKQIGNWFKESLPKNTVVATFPNGGFSFYNELYTIDIAGLTDEHIARKGFRLHYGMPGHIANDDYYVVERNPDIVAVMYGQGFEDHLITYVPEPYTPKYDCVSFKFLNGDNTCGTYVNLLINKSRTNELIRLLSRQDIIHI